MKNAIRKSVPPCLGSCLAVSVVQLFRHMGVWTADDFVINFILTFLITSLIVTPCGWLWGRIRGAKGKKAG